jgi:hypothetical protein
VLSSQKCQVNRRAREFLKELATAPPGSTPGAEGQDIGKLTATITDLQKQIGDLQKAALQQAEEPPAAPEPAVAAPAVTTPTTTQGTVGTTTQPQSPQPATQAKPGTPMGQQPPVGQAQIPPEKVQQKTPPSVSQPSTITNMKIKQQLAKSQAGGTK